MLGPLKPLTDEAALQTFIDITDDSHDIKDINRILLLTDNMPLAVDLLAHLVDYEGCASVLTRWQTEKTTLLSEGFDKRSNLDRSIAISLSSPRITNLPGSRDLLSLLSILPDGISDAELLKYKLPIQNLLGAKAALLRTSLAYLDGKMRLKSLVPIREHVQHFYLPSSSLTRPLRNYFHSLLDLYEKYPGFQQTAGRVDEINSNLGNLEQVLLLGLDHHLDDLPDTIHCALALNSFRRLSGHGRTLLMDHIPAALPQAAHPGLEISYLTEVFHSGINLAIPNPDVLIKRATSQLHKCDDPVLECKSFKSLYR
jgi:hypothetical protein